LLVILLSPIIVVSIDFFANWALNVSGSTGIDGLRGLGQYKYQSNPFIPLIPVLFAGSTGIDGLRGLGQYKYQSNPFIPLIPVLFAGSTGIDGFRGLDQSNPR
jgi:hypothetical protein